MTRIEALRCRAVTVPVDPPLQSASGELSSMPMLLLDVTDTDAVTGHAYALCYSPVVLAAAWPYAQALGELLVGGPAAPRAAAESLGPRLRLLGRRGIAAMVTGALDMALWDLTARRAGLPLARLLGAEPMAVASYASLRSADPTAIAGEAETAAAAGFRAFKVKIGHGPVAGDLAAVAAVRAAAGDDATVMVDYNQSLSVPDAIARARHLAVAGVAWIEEPVDADDLDAHARVRSASTVPIQLGENWQGPRDAARAIAARASDLAMLDPMQIGGVTGWLAAAALADAAALPVSSHAFVEISAHLLAATPHRHWLEWLDLAGPILHDPVVPIAGTVTPTDAPGSGVEWDEDAVARHAAD